MTSILLVKTSSLGDVVHNLPVVSDIRRALPDAAIDWLVETTYEAIPRLHGGVRAVIPMGVRRWRKSWWRRETRRELQAAIARLQSQHYDAVIDTQGLLKSALLARAARGTRYGLDWASAREPLGWLYDRTFSVSWTMHAVERNRELVARALGYERTAEVEYGVDARRDVLDVHTASNNYAVLMHSTSARAKLWREDDWLACADWLAKRGTRVVLPWGSADERARSERLAGRMSHATVPALLSLREAAALLAGAQLVIGLDTGLTHLAGALGVPTVGVYVSTDPSATGLYGCRRALNIGSARGAPPAGEVIASADLLLAAA